ncbi:MAG: hypothetical protein QNJ30_12425 [Kiloniellales bacterium]|nr:hypothetical protein [Kiloniellales bacterium]
MALEGLQAKGPGSVGVFAIPVAHRHHEADVGNAVVVLLDPQDLGDLHQVAGTQAREGRAGDDVVRTRGLGLARQCDLGQ